MSGVVGICVVDSDGDGRPMVFLTDLATNATEKGVHVIIYSGNDDSLVAHTGSQGESLRRRASSRRN